MSRCALTPTIRRWSVTFHPYLAVFTGIEGCQQTGDGCIRRSLGRLRRAPVLSDVTPGGRWFQRSPSRPFGSRSLPLVCWAGASHSENYSSLLLCGHHSVPPPRPVPMVTPTNTVRGPTLHLRLANVRTLRAAGRQSVFCQFQRPGAKKHYPRCR